MPITHRRTEMVQTATAKAGGMRSTLIWSLDKGLGIVESNSQFLIADIANLTVGPALDAAGSQAALRQPAKAVNARADNTGI